MSYGEALFSFEGRMSVRDYWLKGAIFLIPLGVFNNFLAYGVGTEAAMSLSMFIGLVSIWPALALAVKRMHDHIVVSILIKKQENLFLRIFHRMEHTYLIMKS